MERERVRSAAVEMVVVVCAAGMVVMETVCKVTMCLLHTGDCLALSHMHHWVPTAHAYRSRHHQQLQEAEESANNRRREIVRQTAANDRQRETEEVKIPDSQLAT